MLTLIRGGEVFAPQPLGARDVLLAGSSIVTVAEPGSVRLSGLEVEEIDAGGRFIVPGIVDPHVHILGGGGEGGPATRAPEIRIEDIVSCGVTTLIGCLGTDGITRHMSSLVAKARALDAEGVSTFVFSGSYELPVNTLTGSVRSDLVLVDKVIGAGEIAISDHRSSQPTFDEIARLAAECRVGGMLGAKAGILHLHLGDGPRGLEYVRRLAAETEIPITQVVPTHCNRNPRLLAETADHLAAGGCADLTAGLEAHGAGVSVAQSIRLFRERGIGLDRVTVSSDANGSIPVFDDAGELIGMDVASQRELLGSFKDLVASGLLDLAAAAALLSANPASIYKLQGKGRLEPGADADLLLLDRQLNIVDAFARGRRVVRDGRVCARSTFSVAWAPRD